MKKNQNCCLEKDTTNTKKGIISGILYGLIPHSFCLAFALFSVVGAITASVFLKKILLIPNIFSYLILISLILASISVFFYLRKTKCLCKKGIKSNWKYISIIYSTTIIINLVFFYGVIPALANINTEKISYNQQFQEISLKVGIPCTGHSFLIIDEVKKLKGIIDVNFITPDIFQIKYDPENTNPKEIESLEIFKMFKATIE